jgi:tetratricopeptide (TPR) repeat protein
MKNVLFILVLLLLYSQGLYSQAHFNNKEAERLYYDGRELMSTGKLEYAINTFLTAMKQEPQNMWLMRDLGKAYSYNLNYTEALNWLNEAMQSPYADDQCYQLKAECLDAQGLHKSARKTLQRGLSLFPQSGLLYHEMGKHKAEFDHNTRAAMGYWLDGIRIAPSNRLNYYEVVKVFSRTNKVVWVIVYGEIFVNLEPETPRADEVRSLMLAALQRIISNNASVSNEVKAAYLPDNGNFESAVFNSIYKYRSVFNDGLNIENWVILKSRIAMDWRVHFWDVYPFSLFAFHDELMRNGNFEMYNEWLIGKQLNETAHNMQINKFHTEWENFLKYKLALPYQPKSSDFYVDRNLKHIISKRF